MPQKPGCELESHGRIMVKKSMRKNNFPTVLACLVLTGLATLGPGCSRKPSGSTGNLALLHAALRENLNLTREFKAGKLNKEDFDAQYDERDRVIRREYAAHQDEVWSYSCNILSNTPIATATRDKVNALTPLVRWVATDEWDDGANPVASMYCMLPLRMTTKLVHPALSQAELNNVQYAFRSVELLDLTASRCRTAFLFGHKIVTVEFSRQPLHWKPEYINMYYKAPPTPREKQP